MVSTGPRAGIKDISKVSFDLILKKSLPLFNKKHKQGKYLFKGQDDPDQPYDKTILDFPDELDKQD